MFELNSLFGYHLLLILKGVSELARDDIGKAPVILKVFLKEIFKFGLYHWVFGFKATFILMLLLNHYSVEKWGSKKDLVCFVCSSSFEIVLVLLAKMIVLKMWNFIIKIGKLSLKSLFTRTNSIVLYQQFDSGRIRFHYLII